MKVLQIIDSLATGGAEKLILDSVPLYRKAGIEMDVLVLKDENYPFMQQLEVQHSCKIFKLGTGSVYSPNHILGIANILADYDIAHVHLFPAQYWAVLAKKYSGAKTKLVFTVHNTSNRRLNHKILGRIDRYFFRQYDRVIAISDEIQDIFANHTAIQTHKFEVICNGVNLYQYANAKGLSRDKLGLSAKDMVLIQVSSFRQQKDQQTIIKALTHLPANVKILLAGEGPTLENCKQLATNLNLCDRVQFLGNRSDVPQLLKMADVVVLSSHHEGMSLSSIEGMSSGRPFVASDVPGLTEIVKDAGILFEQGNEKALAEIIKELFSNKTYYEETILNCIKRAKHFDISKMVKNYIDLYNSVLEK